MATTLEHISHYKGEDVLVWRDEMGRRIFSWGNQRYQSLCEARTVIDSRGKKPWLIYRESVGENNIIGNLLWETIKEIHNGHILEVDVDERYVIVE